MAKFKIKTLLLYPLLLSLWFGGSEACGQEPIAVTITQLPPYPNYVDEVVNMGNETILSLQNTDFNNGYSLKLDVELSGGNGIIVRTKENSLPNNPIVIGPGETIVLTGEDLSSFYNNYGESDFDFIGISIDDIINDQQLPDGSYTICVRAYDYNNGMPLSLTSPSGCTVPFTVVSVSPPIITYPNDGAVLSAIEPQLLNINWIPVSISLPDLRYRVEMVDLTDMPMNPYDAFQTGDFLFFYEEDVISNSFIYGMEYPELLDGHEYAIRVRAYRQDGLLNVMNSGYSDIVQFTYGDTLVTTVFENEPDSIDEGTTYTQVPLPDSDLTCGSSCQYLLTGNESSASSSPQVGDFLQMGHYQLKVTNIQGSGTYSGSGVIQATDYIPVGIKVNFTGLRVAADGRIFDGSAQAEIRQGSWIDETWADLQTQTEALNINNFSDLYDEANNDALFVDHLATLYESVGTSIPISIGDEDHGLQVVGMHFFPDRAAYNLSYLTRLDDDPSGTRYLHFMGKDLCITPGGPSVGVDEARLELVKPMRFKFDQSTTLIFEAASSGVAGSYLAFDCEGFNGISASGEVRFDPDVFKPVDSNGNVQEGDTVVAGFNANFVNWSDWVALVTFDTNQASNTVDTDQLFIYKELEDYVIRVSNAFLDHSVESNPETLVFPDNFNGNTGPDWQGFYIESLRVDLPEWLKPYGESEERVQLVGRHLLVDSDGLTGKIQASNILSQKEGAMGKWPVTIDSVSVEIWQNHLVEAYFGGGLKIPVIDEPFDYTADIQFLPEGTSHTFSFQPIESYTFSTWFANASLNENCYLEVNVGNDQAFIEANLHGEISFAPAIGGIDKMNLTDITFENMIIRSAKTPSYIEIGEIGTGVNGQSLAVAGFGIALETLGWDENAVETTGLEIGIGLDLAGASNAISGGTTMFIKNEIESFSDSISFSFDGVDIREIHLAVETGAVNIDGTIAFFRDDPKFGNGFEGSLELGILETIALSGTVLFGNKQISNEKINYWYAYAIAYLPNSPVPMATPLDVYGFGGGVYYNLAMDPDLPDPSATGGPNVNPRDVFVVAPGILGIKATVVMGLTPSARTFNADVTLTAELNLETGGVNMIALNGNGYIMQKLDATNKEDAMVRASVGIMYDFPAKTFSASCGLEGSIPKGSPLLEISGDIAFYRSPDLWYFKAGIPKEMLSTSIDLGVVGIDAGAYFMTGMDLPPPILPKKISSFFNFESKMVNNIQNGMGIGFMAGLHLELDVNLKALGTGIEINGLAGADIAVLNFYAATCNGDEDFGVNKWYAMGQGYVYGRFALDVFTAKIASLELGVVLEAAFPNPTGVRGVVKAEAKFLIFEVDVEEDFQIGTFCDIQPMVNIEEVVERKELELENMDLIGVVTPASTANGVSVVVQPTIQWHKKDLSEKRYVYADGMGGLIDQLYRFKNSVSWKKQNENETWSVIDFSKTLDETELINTLAAQNANGNPSLLHGSALYKVTAKTSIEKLNIGTAYYFDNSYLTNVWDPALYLEGPNEGSPIEEVVAHQFTTTSSLTEIEELYVDYTLPYPRQRFYPYGYLNTGEIDFNMDHEPKFQDFEECGFILHAEFEPVHGGSVQQVEVTRENLMQVNYSMATLAPSTIYALTIVAEREVTPSELANEVEEHCQLNDSQTLSDLIADYGIDLEMNNFNAGGVVDIGPMTGEVFGTLLPSGESEGSVVQRKELFTIHFRTSKYATPQEKLNSMSVSDVDMVDMLIYNYPSFTYVKDARISINCGEGFDKYDLFGHDYSASETMEYFRPYGAGCNTDGMESAVQNWYDNTCAALYGFGSNPSGDGGSGMPGGNNGFGAAAQMAQEMADGQPQLWNMSYRSDPSNYTGVKHIKPLLSDVECGLASSETSGSYDPSTLGLIGEEETETSSSGSSSGYGSGGFGMGGFGAGGATYSVEGMQNPSLPGSGLPNFGGSSPELEMWFKPDRTAYNMRTFLLNAGLYSLSSSYEHVHPPNANYPITISLSNTNFDANEDPFPINHKTFDVSLPF